MVFGFALLTIAALYLVSGFTGKSLAETIRGQVGRGFALADVNVPGVQFEPSSSDSAGGTAGATIPASFTSGKVKGQQVVEVFHDPLGYYFDSGRVNRGSIGRHSDHVHVSAVPHAYAVQLATVAQRRFHLNVRELEPFDRVDPVHTDGSYHYRSDATGHGQAFDASGNPRDMIAFAKWVIGVASS